MRNNGRDLTSEIRELLADRKATRDDVATLYMKAIATAEDGFPWADINNAIIARWSYSALLYIKRQAWLP